MRNGRTSTRSLRATISAPTIASAAGRPQVALADQRVEALADPEADVAAVPVGPDDEAEEHAQREQAEPDQLGMLVPFGLLAPRACAV